MRRLADCEKHVSVPYITSRAEALVVALMSSLVEFLSSEIKAVRL